MVSVLIVTIFDKVVRLSINFVKALKNYILYRTNQYRQSIIYQCVKKVNLLAYVLRCEIIY